MDGNATSHSSEPERRTSLPPDSTTILIVGRILIASFMLIGMNALPCTCVTVVNSTANTLMADDAVVFRGLVIERKTLPLRADMRGRNRYSITFRVEEYWKGTPGRRFVVYGLDSGTDCLGDGGYKVGKEYLVYAAEQQARDVRLDDYLWYGWTDILPERSVMFVPDTACKPGGEVPEANVRTALRELGRGRVPADETKR